jgi:hypothetical protein
MCKHRSKTAAPLSQKHRSKAAAAEHPRIYSIPLTGFGLMPEEQMGRKVHTDMDIWTEIRRKVLVGLT